MSYILKSPIVERMTLHNPEQQGNHLIILDIWRQRITKDTKRRNSIPYDEAINLYAETVSWYKPHYPKPVNGKIKPPEQKFKHLHFKHSYEAIYNRFGYTERIASKAFSYLESQELLQRVTENRRYGKDMYIVLNFANYLKISKPETTNQWKESNLKGKAETSPFSSPTEIRGYDRFLLENLAESMIMVICGSSFRKLKTWLSEINERDLENTLLLCTNIIKFPDEYKTVREFPGLIRSMATSGEKINVPLLCKGWIFEALDQMQMGQIPNFSELEK